MKPRIFLILSLISLYYCQSKDLTSSKLSAIKSRLRTQKGYKEEASIEKLEETKQDVLDDLGKKSTRSDLEAKKRLSSLVKKLKTKTVTDSKSEIVNQLKDQIKKAGTPKPTPTKQCMLCLNRYRFCYDKCSYCWNIEACDNQNFGDLEDCLAYAHCEKPQSESEASETISALEADEAATADLTQQSGSEEQTVLEAEEEANEDLYQEEDSERQSAVEADEEATADLLQEAEEEEQSALEADEEANADLLAQAEEEELSALEADEAATKELFEDEEVEERLAMEEEMEAKAEAQKAAEETKAQECEEGAILCSQALVDAGLPCELGSCFSAPKRKSTTTKKPALHSAKDFLPKADTVMPKPTMKKTETSACEFCLQHTDLLTCKEKCNYCWNRSECISKKFNAASVCWEEECSKYPPAEVKTRPPLKEAAPRSPKTSTTSSRTTTKENPILPSKAKKDAPTAEVMKKVEPEGPTVVNMKAEIIQEEEKKVEEEERESETGSEEQEAGEEVMDEEQEQEFLQEEEEAVKEEVMQEEAVEDVDVMGEEEEQENSVMNDEEEEEFLQEEEEAMKQEAVEEEEVDEIEDKEDPNVGESEEVIDDEEVSDENELSADEEEEEAKQGEDEEEFFDDGEEDTLSQEEEDERKWDSRDSRDSRDSKETRSGDYYDQGSGYYEQEEWDSRDSSRESGDEDWDEESDQSKPEVWTMDDMGTSESKDDDFQVGLSEDEFDDDDFGMEDDFGGSSNEMSSVDRCVDCFHDYDDWQTRCEKCWNSDGCQDILTSVEVCLETFGEEDFRL